MTDSLLYKWRQHLRQAGVDAFPSNGQLSAHDEEVRRLERQLREEREIPKKAMVCAAVALRSHFVHQARHRYAVELLCRVLQTSRAGY